MFSASTPLLFLNLGGGEVIFILLVILMLFGGKGFPTIARSLGRSIREFKDAASGIKEDITGNFGDVRNEVNEHIQEVKKRVDETHPEK
ncbi:MAG: twin-arginine translocase TatA/TatE family subunit [Bacteroidota bacterium]|jgi:sec-independent protein translocase protein TatA